MGILILLYEIIIKFFYNYQVLGERQNDKGDKN